MYAVFLINLFILSFLLQSTLLHNLTVAGVRPDLILLLACLVGLFFGRHKGLLLGGLTGLIQDCLSGGLFGLNILCKGLVGFIAGVLQHHIGVQHRLLQMLVVALLTALDGFLALGLVSLYRDSLIPVQAMTKLVAAQMLYNGLVAAPYFAVLTRIARRYTPPGGYADLPAASSGLRSWFRRDSYKMSR